MQKFFVIVIALAAAGASAYILFDKGMTYTLPINGVMSSSASSQIRDVFDSFVPAGSSSSEDTLLQDAGLTASSSLSSSAASRRITTLTSAVYADYKAGVIGNGETSVLFFHDKTDAASRATDAAIKATYKTGTPGVTTYRVDFGAYASLKTTYGVKAANTVVRVDGTGISVQSVTSPNRSDLETLLK